jgi:hypothetical protein
MKIIDVPKSGKLERVVAFQSRFGLCLRELVIPRNTITEARQHMRGVFGSNSQMWSRRLSQEQRDRWNLAGPRVMSHPQLAQSGPLTGQLLWQSINSVRGRVGLAPVFEPPAPAAFSRSVVGPLGIENGQEGVRMWLEVAGELSEEVMVFGQAPCSAGRNKRRNVAYLGLLRPPAGGRSEITDLYKARFGEPRPGTRVFIVTCQQKDGWKGMEQATSEIVPSRPEDQQTATTGIARGIPAADEGENSQKALMHKGCTPAAEGDNTRTERPLLGGKEAGKRGERAEGSGFEQAGGCPGGMGGSG